jgi:hypothetical protein
MTIRSLSSLTPAQRRLLQSNNQAEAKSSGPVDSVDVKAQGNYREPQKAVSFMNDFNAKLGISKAMKSEKAQIMAESSHSFFRASPALFYHDLQTTYKRDSKLLPTPAPTTTILGDAHALNAGTFRGPGGKTVWGLNDFDQAAMGSPEWDLERLGVSLYIAARSAGESSKDCKDLVETMGKAYIDGLDEDGPSYFFKDEVKGDIDDLIDEYDSRNQKVHLQKWTDGGRRLKRNDRLVDTDKKRGAQISKALKETFPELTFMDLASKPNSGGSTRGLERYYALVRSEDRDQPWILETKAVLPSPVQIPDGDLGRGDGETVLQLQRQMGGQVDNRHKSFRIGNIAFFTREREREKGSLSESPEHLKESAEHIGRLLARAHTGSGADIKGWIGQREKPFIGKLVRFSQKYARQVESDFREWQSRHPAG